jgi:hypothetical protein
MERDGTTLPFFTHVCYLPDQQGSLTLKYKTENHKCTYNDNLHLEAGNINPYRIVVCTAITAGQPRAVEDVLSKLYADHYFIF